ncbi:hypothetical protein IWW50_002599 [Coemansia erecta]|nr:hypothetical protein IWW50_002599 [Coemansia erecta]
MVPHLPCTQVSKLLLSAVHRNVPTAHSPLSAILAGAMLLKGASTNGSASDSSTTDSIVDSGKGDSDSWEAAVDFTDTFGVLEYEYDECGSDSVDKGAAMLDSELASEAETPD